jgi:hypothetical protein
MRTLTSNLVARAYLGLMLFIATLFAPLPFSLITLVLLILQGYFMFKHVSAGWSLIVVFCALVFIPLALDFSAGVFSAFLITPALFVLDKNLRDFASAQFSKEFSVKGRSTFVLRSLGSALLLVFLLSAALLNVTLMLSIAFLSIYVVVILVYVSRKVPQVLVEESKGLSRIIVGETEKAVIRVKGKAELPLFVSLKPAFSWVKVAPVQFVLAPKEEVKADLVLTPPLAGPSKVVLEAFFVDPWGLSHRTQVLETLDLHIIPRAKFAQWLARRYLEQTAPGSASAVALSPVRAVRAVRQGVEFYGSRAYVPGDRMKDVDWKHTFKLQELVVKEFVGAHGQPAIVIVNLEARSLEEADKLAFNLVMTALTLAVEAVPTSLAAYTRSEVLSTSSAENPREVLKRVLKLTCSIRLVEGAERVLESVEIGLLKRSMRRLESGAKNSSVKRLSELLHFEYQAIEKSAKQHPVSQALLKIVKNTPSPAVVTIVSSVVNENAFAYTVERLKEKGYSTVMVK